MITATANTERQDAGVLSHNQIAAQTWGAGGAGYDRVSRGIADAIEHCVDRLSPRPGDQILDVATGTGWTARRIAARGATVTAVDFAQEVIEAAQALDPLNEIDFRTADAENLPFADGQFDGVVSTFGVMFCARPERAAAELARVCRPGGRLALASWAPDGSVRRMFELIRSHKPGPAPATPSPFEWGKTRRQVELLEEWFDLGFEEATSYYRVPDGAAAWKDFSSGFGPVVTVLSKLDADAARRFRVEFDSFHETYRTGAGVLVPRPYVVTVGRRR